VASVFGIGPPNSLALSFLPNAQGEHHALRLVTEGHDHGIALPNGHYQETFYFIAVKAEETTGPQTSREALAELERVMEDAISAHIPGAGVTVYTYLHETAEGESVVSPAARRAVIYDYVLRELPTDPFWTTNLSLNDGLVKGLLTVERGPWESTPVVSKQPGVPLSYDAGSWLPSGDVGTTDSRIQRLWFAPSQAPSLRRAWIGIRPGDEVGKYFQPKYTMSGTGLHYLDGTAVSDALINETVFQCAFGAGDDLKFRCSRSAGFTAILQGEYLALIAARVTTSGTICRVRFSTSYQTPGDTAGSKTYTYDFKTEEVVDDTEWRVIEVGTARIPFGVSALMPTYMASNIWLNLEAERLAGTGSLRVARIFLLPGYHRIFIDQLNLDTTRNDTVYIHTAPAGDVEVHQVGDWVEIPPIDVYQWRWPRHAPRLVFIGEAYNGWRPTHTVGNFNVEIAAQWGTYRND
jgi:hypothetical protein